LLFWHSKYGAVLSKIHSTDGFFGFKGTGLNFSEKRYINCLFGSTKCDYISKIE